MINVILQQVDITSAATSTRDVNNLCKNVNDFIKNPSVKVNSTQVIAPYVDIGVAIFLIVKIDYSMKSTGG